jgi:hypothetical protein
MAWNGQGKIFDTTHDNFTTIHDSLEYVGIDSEQQW